jgi:triosephosphate isomerase
MYSATLNEAKGLATAFSEAIWPADVTVVLCPAFPFLDAVGQIINTNSKVVLGAQNCSAYEKGAYTGEVSIEMLRNIGCSYAIVGHSERRNLFAETSIAIRDKVSLLQVRGICPVLCVGEPLEVYRQKQSFDYVEQQIKDCLPLQVDRNNIVIAYEPIWAIGSGITPIPEEIQDFSEKLKHRFGMQIIYGGSVNAEFAGKLKDIDALSGLLAGGASVNIDEFSTIVFNFAGINK